MHFAQTAAQRGAGFVASGNTKGSNARAKSGEICRDVSRAAQSFAFLEEVDYGHGCFGRSEEHTSELQSRPQLVCRLRLEKKKKSSKELARASVLHVAALDAIAEIAI